MVHLETIVISKNDRQLLEHILYSLTKLMWTADLTPLPILKRNQARSERRERATVLNQRITKIIRSMYPGVEELHWSCTAVNSKTAHPNCRGEWVFQYDITVDRAYVIQHAIRKLDFTAMHEYGIRTTVNKELDQFKFDLPNGNRPITILKNRPNRGEVTSTPSHYAPFTPEAGGPTVTGAQAIRDGFDDRVAEAQLTRDMHS